jgi:hypothetical protein
MTINNINNTASSMAIGNLGLAVNTISSSDTNGNILFVPNGTGTIGFYGAYSFPVADGTAGQVMKTDGAGVITWEDDEAGSFPWTVLTGTTQTVVVENGYIANNGSQVLAFTLPASAAVGDEFELIAGNASFGFSVLQSAGQSIVIGNTSTTVGTGGSLASTARGDWLRFICFVGGASTTWLCSVQQGNITVV